MTPVAQRSWLVHLGISLCNESPYNQAVGPIQVVSYRLAGKTVDDDVHTLADVTKFGDIPTTMDMLSVDTLDVCYAYAVSPVLVLAVMSVFMIVSKIMLRNLLTHVVDVFDALTHEYDECDDGGSKFCGCNFFPLSLSSRVEGFSELFQAKLAAYGN